MNFIFGHSHFIKTVEDLYEAVIQSVPGVKFGIAFCEASQDRLVRWIFNQISPNECPECWCRSFLHYFHRRRIPGKYAQCNKNGSGSLPGLLCDS